MLYFAYGSNLNHFQMKKRCKDCKFLKKIDLKDFKLTFRSKYRAADIELKKNSISSIQKISENIAANIIENISGEKLNESSIKAAVEDISKKNIGKYL